MCLKIIENGVNEGVAGRRAVLNVLCVLCVLLCSPMCSWVIAKRGPEIRSRPADVSDGSPERTGLSLIDPFAELPVLNFLDQFPIAVRLRFARAPILLHIHLRCPQP